MVTPANEIPEVVGQRKGSKLVICNLQKTPIDKLCNTRVYSKTDELMTRVMKNLDIPIPTFILRRHLVVEFEMKNGRQQLKVYGVDEDGTPVTFLQSVRLERRVLRSEPYIFPFRNSPDAGTSLKLDLEFMGHYSEPNLEIIHEYLNSEDTKTTYRLEYNPFNGAWKTTQKATDVISD